MAEPPQAATAATTTAHALVGRPPAAPSDSRWTSDECQSFLNGLEEHGKDTNAAKELFVQSHTVVQIRIRVQEHFQSRGEQGARGAADWDSPLAVEAQASMGEAGGSPREGSSTPSGLAGNSTDTTPTMRSSQQAFSSQEGDIFSPEVAAGTEFSPAFTPSACSAGNLSTSPPWAYDEARQPNAGDQAFVVWLGYKGLVAGQQNQRNDSAEGGRQAEQMMLVYQDVFGVL